MKTGVKFLQAVSCGALLSALLMFAFPQEVKAAEAKDKCTGGHWICATWNSGWKKNSTTTAKAYVDLKDFTWPTNPTGYPITSTNAITRETSKIFVKYAVSMGYPGTSVSIAAVPTEHLEWDSAHNAYKVKGTAPGLDKIRFTFQLTADNGAYSTATGTTGTTMTGQVPSVGNGIEYAVQVKVRAIVIEDLGNINSIVLPNVQIFRINFSSASDMADIGGIYISGSSTISPLPPKPAPKTCTAQTTLGDHTVELGTHDISAFSAQEVGSGNKTLTLKQCPSGGKVKLNFAEASGVPSGITTSPDYLVNRNTASANASGVGVKLYYNGTTDAFTLGTDKQITTATCPSGQSTCDSPINIYARLYRIGATGAVTPGHVNAAGILTVKYQ